MRVFSGKVSVHCSVTWWVSVLGHAFYQLRVSSFPLRVDEVLNDFGNCCATRLLLNLYS